MCESLSPTEKNSIGLLDVNRLTDCILRYIDEDALTQRLEWIRNRVAQTTVHAMTMEIDALNKDREDDKCKKSKSATSHSVKYFNCEKTDHLKKDCRVDDDVAATNIQKRNDQQNELTREQVSRVKREILRVGSTTKEYLSKKIVQYRNRNQAISLVSTIKYWHWVEYTARDLLNYPENWHWRKLILTLELHSRTCQWDSVQTIQVRSIYSKSGICSSNYDRCAMTKWRVLHVSRVSTMTHFVRHSSEFPTSRKLWCLMNVSRTVHMSIDDYMNFARRATCTMSTGTFCFSTRASGPRQICPLPRHVREDPVGERRRSDVRT